MTATEQKARQLAAKIGAKLTVGFDVIEADLPIGGRIFGWSGTESLITSRETGETDASMWKDMLDQLKSGTHPRSIRQQRRTNP